MPLSMSQGHNLDPHRNSLIEKNQLMT